jgi:hypothetical protein
MAGTYRRAPIAAPSARWKARIADPKMAGTTDPAPLTDYKIDYKMAGTN